MKKIKQFDVVNIKGTVVDVYNNGEAYEIEIVNNDGTTTALFTMESKHLLSEDKDKE
jgi:hypothetical protein